jgi:2-polyprenyl-3-methyl-5-hydroxy-6-metoxy-1,4-benzoquinol methylase
MLHYGYFENIDIAAEDISLKAIEDAQIKYAQNIIDLIKNKDGLILDVGCGMGGLSGMLAAEKLKVEALTPNINQKNTMGLNATIPSLKIFNQQTNTKPLLILNLYNTST